MTSGTFLKLSGKRKKKRENAKIERIVWKLGKILLKINVKKSGFEENRLRIMMKIGKFPLKKREWEAYLTNYQKFM